MKDMNMNMKIWKKTAAFTAVALATGLVACTDDLGMGNSQAMDPSEVVCFTTGSTVGESREPFTRHAGYLEETAEEWELTGTESPTRAAVETSLYDYFDNAGVRIFMYDGDWSPSNTDVREIPEEPALSHGMPALPGTFNASGLLSPITPILWSSSKAEHATHTSSGTTAFFEHFRAYAFAPLTGTEKNRYHGINNLSAAGYTTYEHGGIGVPPSITYTVPDEPADQVDLIAACTGELDGDLCSTVPMTFRHVLSAVEFRLGFEQTTKVKSLTISGVYKKGTGSFNDSNELTVVSDADGNGNGTPGEVDDLYTYSFTWKNGSEEYKEYVWDGDHFTSGNVLTDGDNTLMMMPQTLPEGAYVTLVYCVRDGGGGDYGDDKTITCDISGFQWKAGHRYVYTLKESPAYDIYFDLAAGKVTINNTTYSGKVYVNGVATTVSGSHVASNKYYVYQSTGETTDEYGKDHTGWETAIGTGICGIPTYPSVMSPDGKQNWADYVTDNSDADLVGTSWVSCAASAQRKMVGGNINYYIDINNTTADVTLDNIYIDYTTVHTNAAIRVQGASGNGIFRLKGENKVNKLYNTDNSSRITITSYYGDESSRGTLTVTSYNNMPLGSNDSYSNRARAMIGGGSGTQSTVIIKGGTIFVATPELPDKCSGYTGSCLGGGNTQGGYVYISGGRVTAVSHGNGAAIGGGAGFHAAGGFGYVYISGGEVYAYQFGASTNYVSGDSPEPVACTSTAIGGGSAFNNKSSLGHVEISGGYVYAQSIGGVAIGGATSMGSAGARGEITISGGTVIAKSLSGTIRNKWNNQEWNFDASTAIGGGSGGNEKRREGNTDNANGGEAIVNITGGTVIAGSVGGGKQGESSAGVKRLLGNATITMSGSPDVQAQMVMADTGGSSTPSFTMSGGKLHLVDDSYEFIRDNGGAVWMDAGDCSITSGTISDFKAQDGGAVYIQRANNSTSSTAINFTMSGGTIQNCRANYKSGAGGNGGALYISDGKGLATVNITGGTITNNYADWNGGAVYLEGGNVNISGGTMKVNSALGVPGISATEKGNGGGVYLMEGNLTMSGGVVNGNKATRNGGGLYVSSSSQNIMVNITGGEITGNVAENYGAGLFVLPKAGLSATVNIGIDDATYSRLLPKITGNSASLRGGGIYAQSTSGDPANPNAVLNLYDGKIKDNYVSAYVYNQSVTNEGGSVTLALDDDGKPVPDLDYITVTIDPAGGDFTDGNTSADPAYRYLVKASNSTLAIPTPKRKNFRFIGWLPSQGEADTKVAVYTDGMTFNYDKDLTLTAQWELAN